MLFRSTKTLTFTNLVTYLAGLCSAGWNADTATLATTATDAVNLTGSGTVSDTTTGGAALTPTSAANAQTTANNAVPKDVGYGQVGSVIFAVVGSGTVANGATVAGSIIAPLLLTAPGGTSLSTSTTVGSVLSGTWRNITGASLVGTAANVGFLQRIS